MKPAPIVSVQEIQGSLEQRVIPPQCAALIVFCPEPGKFSFAVLADAETGPEGSLAQFAMQIAMGVQHQAMMQRSEAVTRDDNVPASSETPAPEEETHE